MPGPAFHPDDIGDVIGPAEAFDPGHDSTPNTYALQHHLALEVVAHLEQDEVPFWFRGGTALHTRLPERTRFSSDVDVSTADATALHDALRAFTKRFQRSDIELQEPPKDLRVAGVQHQLDFGHTKEGATGNAVRVLVEVVEIEEPADGFEALRLHGDGHDWGVDVLAPTYETFMAQKLAVLGPKTVGKPVGLNEDFVHQNQGVCKQIFDLRELLRQDLDPEDVQAAYAAAVDEANALRKTAFEPPECLADARDLLFRLRGPRSKDKTEPVRYGLWAGYAHSMRWIAPRARESWRDRDYRIAGGVVTRVVDSLAEGGLDPASIRGPIVEDIVPQQVQGGIETASSEEEEWFSQEDFGADAMLAWAWAPRPLWR